MRSHSINVNEDSLDDMDYNERGAEHEAEDELQSEPGNDAEDEVQSEAGNEAEDEVHSEAGNEDQNEAGNEVENDIENDIENEVDPWVDDPPLELDNDADPFLDDLHLVCPVCDLHFPIATFRNHMLHTHPEFLAIWASALFGPLFQQDEYFTFVRGMVADTEEFANIDIDHMSYEQLLELCEQIGDHKEGIANIEEVLEKVDVLQGQPHEYVYAHCPICLDEFSAAEEAVQVEKIKSCGHIFCSECIRKWFSQNKQCPFCKCDANANAGTGAES